MKTKQFNRKCKKKGSNRGLFSKSIIIWITIGMIITALWSIYNNQTNEFQKWNIGRAVVATQQGLVLKGEMENDTTGGSNWYIARGLVEDENYIYQSQEHNEVRPISTNLKKKRIRFRAEGRLTDKDFSILQDSGVYIEERNSSIFKEFILGVAPFLIFISLIYFTFIKQLKTTGRSAMGFGKSTAKMLTENRNKITFNDVAGCDEAKEEIQEIVEFLKDPSRFQKIGGNVPRGALMIGPPGTGKTLLARAIAGEADVPFFNISGSDFVEMFVGVGAARVRDMFDQGRKHSPCLIFIDEIDAVGRQRGSGSGGGNDEREQTLNSILVEMDGFDSRDGVIIIAATNRPDVLDNALLRPGRFDRQIMIDLPDLNGRKQILKLHSKKIKIEGDLDFHSIACNIPGFSGADIQNLMNESALIAARRNKETVEMVDIEEAREKISYGRERRKLMDKEDKKITAYHEAGHAVVQVSIDNGFLPIHKVTIVPRGRSLGSTMLSPRKDILNHTKNNLLNQICCSMGGRIAEEIVFNEITSGAAGDIEMATKIARQMICDLGMSRLGLISLGESREHFFSGKETSRSQNYSEKTAQNIDQEVINIINVQYNRAYDILEKNIKGLDDIAKALLEHETISGSQVKKLLRSVKSKQQNPLGGKE